MKAVELACAQYPDLLELHYGKKVLKVRPKVKWDKGKAAPWILQHAADKNTLLICVGDDETDEDIFQALPFSIAIRVGDEATAARYRVSNPDQVRAVLYEIDAPIANRY